MPRLRQLQFLVSCTYRLRLGWCGLRRPRSTEEHTEGALGNNNGFNLNPTGAATDKPFICVLSVRMGVALAMAWNPMRPPGIGRELVTGMMANHTCLVHAAIFYFCCACSSMVHLLLYAEHMHLGSCQIPGPK